MMKNNIKEHHSIGNFRPAGIGRYLLGLLLIVCLILPESGLAQTVDLAGEVMGTVQERDGSGYFRYEDPGLLMPADGVISSNGGGKNTRAVTLPARYDLRDYGRVSAVQDQGNYGVCWAFATLASLESNLITRGYATSSLNLSEAQLAYFNYHGKNANAKSRYGGKDTFRASRWYNSGGSYVMTVATLGRWYGAIPESTLPYRTMRSTVAYGAKYRTMKNYLLTDAYFLPDTLTARGALLPAAQNLVKQAIIDYGACAVGIGMYKGGFGTNVSSEDYSNQISYYSVGTVPNHAVTVVGWNDNYDFTKAGFQGTKPKGKGAWLVKNSWGAVRNGKRVHQDGYFWVSYYNPSLTNFVTFIGDKKTGGSAVHQNLYQYDGVGMGDSLLVSTSKVRAANTFTARKDTLLDSVSTWFPAASSKVNVQIYVNKQKASPTSGKRLYNKTFGTKLAGYRTLSLGKTVGIPKGSKFSVIITTKATARTWYCPFEMKASTGSSVTLAAQKAGESYLYVGGKWKDTRTAQTKYLDENGVKIRYKIGNAVVKAHGRNGGSKAQKIKAAKRKTLRKGKKWSIHARRTRGNGKLVYRSSNPKIATVSAKGVVKARRKGTVKITVNALPTKGYRSAGKTIRIKVR